MILKQSQASEMKILKMDSFIILEVEAGAIEAPTDLARHEEKNVPG
jgi:hypothetical protein